MQLKLNSQRCIACGLCFRQHPDLFQLDDQGIAHFKKELTPNDALIISRKQIKDLRVIINHCPGRAFEIKL